MAPGNISKKSRQPHAANVRAKTLEKVAQMAQQEGEEHKKKIEEYEKLLQQRDEELEALTKDQLREIGFDEMEIDTDIDEKGHGGEN
ncbi:hypothetical protein J7T55_007044, partial [Diaporthe amygdali]|uniref:uncharacterized protein n=1 Tax=Phomopsis amygdali TaxID=1214568 RepID=UPI0022FDCC21